MLLASVCFLESYSAVCTARIVMSTDCMHVAEFPSLADLAKLRYRIWVPGSFMKNGIIQLLTRNPRITSIFRSLFHLLGGTT